MSSSQPTPDRLKAFVDRLYRSLDALYHSGHAANPHSELIAHLAAGLTVEGIAAAEGVDADDVRQRLADARSSFCAKTNEELVAVAVRDGLVEIP